jgi:hypothetical protein
MPGPGRGSAAPDRGPAAPGRGAPGRGGIPGAPGRAGRPGAPGRAGLAGRGGMPGAGPGRVGALGAGRGAAGRGGMGVGALGELNGLLPGRADAGPGRAGIPGGAGSDGAAGSLAAAAGRSGASGRGEPGSGTSAGPGPPSESGRRCGLAAGVTGATGVGRTGPGSGASGSRPTATAAVAAVRCGLGRPIGAAVGATPAAGPGNASRNLRATGGSTVDDADFTNSPSSLSLARTTLLSTPSSLASSCTRALPATVLLVWPALPAAGAASARPKLLLHGRTHGEGLIERSSRSRPAFWWTVVLVSVFGAGGPETPAVCRRLGPTGSVDRGPETGVVERSGHAQCPGKRSPPLGQVEAAPVGMQGCTSTRQPAAKVGDEHALNDHDPKQIRLRRPSPASDTGARRRRMATCRF